METAITTYQPPTETITVPQAAVQPTQPDKDSWSLKDKLIFSVFSIVVLGGSVYIVKKIIVNKIANKEENKSFEDGTSATSAKQIKMAFENDGWPGTDTPALRNILREIKSKEEFDKVSKSYERLYTTPTQKANLLRDLSDELQTTEYNEMLQILAAKPDKKGQAPSSIAYTAWAKRMKAAFDKAYGFFGGTDGEAIVAVFNEIPTQSAFVKVAVEYQRLFTSKLLEDLKSESEFGQYDEWMQIITAKSK